MNPWDGTGTLAELLIDLFHAGRTDQIARNAKYKSHEDELMADMAEYNRRILAAIPDIIIVPPF